MNCVAGWPFWGMPLNDHAPPAGSWHKNCAPIKGKPSLQLLSRKGLPSHFITLGSHLRLLKSRLATSQ